MPRVWDRAPSRGDGISCCISGGNPGGSFGAAVLGRLGVGGVNVLEASPAFGAFGADFGAFAARMPVMRRVDQHEMRRRPAHFGARHHQAEMLGLDVPAAGLEAMVHRRAEACLVAAHAERDAARHVFGLSHPFFSSCATPSPPHNQDQKTRFVPDSGRL